MTLGQAFVIAFLLMWVVLALAMAAIKRGDLVADRELAQARVLSTLSTLSTPPPRIEDPTAPPVTAEQVHQWLRPETSARIKAGVMMEARR